MKIKKILLTVILILVNIQASFAITTDEVVEKYANILDRYEQKYNEQKFFRLLDTLDRKIDIYSKKQGISQSKMILLFALKQENAERKEKKSDNEVTSSSGNNEAIIEQKLIESTIRKKLQEEIRDSNISSTIFDTFEKEGYEIKIVSAQFEYVTGNDIKKLSFKTYLPVDTSNYSNLARKNRSSQIGKTLVYDGQFYYIPQTEQTIITKNAYSRSESLFLDAITRGENYVLENGEYFSYKFEKFLFFQDKYGFYSDELTANNINAKKSVLLIEGDGFKIIKDYQKKRLIQASIIERVTDKKGFLAVLIKDANYTSSENNDLLFTRLKNKTKTLTSNETQSTKIAAIYDYILDNYEYYEDFKDGSQEIFSGIDTYKNGYGVCDGYSKLMYYMLAFAGISDIEHIRGYVIDAPDFPEIGHAWIRIGDYYYDPTFDDPLGQQTTLQKSEYRYFQLPKDIAYSNRMDGFNVSDNLKEKTLSERKEIVEENLFAILDDYDIGTYNLLQPFQLKNELGIKPGDILTIETLKSKLPYYHVSSNFSYTDEKGKLQKIAQLKYYVPTDDNINAIIDALGENFRDSVLLKWDLGNDEFEYRLAYVFVIR